MKGINPSFLKSLLLCTNAGTIGDVTHDTCGEEIGAIEFFLIWKVKKDDNSLNEIAYAADAHKTLGTYTALFGLSTDEKMQKSPILHNPQPSGGEPIPYGGGDETSGGISILMGSEPSLIEAELIRRKSATIKSLKAYNGVENIGVILINANGEFWGVVDDLTTPTMFRPIPIQSFFTGDKIPGTRSTPDKNPIRFSMRENWSDNVAGFKPNFDPFTELP